MNTTKVAGLSPTEPESAMRQVLFARTSDSRITIGVVSDSPPSSLALLAAGVAGMAARQARRRERVKFFQITRE
jgi:MYXO-CTERM domain-containing protein